MSEYYAVVREGDSLKHFGVLGMRWGIRHDRRVKAAKAMYKTNRKAINRDKSLSKGQKQKKIAASREQWMKERESAANRLYSLNGKEVNRTIARQSSGKTLAKAALMGSEGSLTYQKVKAKTGSRTKAALAGAATSAAQGVPYLGLGVQGASWAYYAKNRQARKNKKR